jgi:excisionase family DNA binding protein
MKYLTINGLSLYLNVSKPTIYVWIAKNFIPYIRINKRLIRFDKDKIDAWIMKHENKIS